MIDAGTTRDTKPLKTTLKIADNISAVMHESNKNYVGLIEALGWTARDTDRIFDGTIMLNPVILEKIADYLGTTKERLTEGIADL